MTQPPSPEKSSADPSPARGAAAPQLVLASESPRRQSLLAEAGYKFTVYPARIDESKAPSMLLPSELAVYLAQAKAEAVAAIHPKSAVLAADTVVAFGDRALGKPADAEDARQMLDLLAGTTHIVITGVTVRLLAKGYSRTRVSMTAVRMRPLTAEQIAQYVESSQWEGKAGGYGIQDEDPFVIRVSGSHTNVVGLPMELTREMLAAVGVTPSVGA